MRLADSLVKVVKEKDELRDSNSQFKRGIKDLKLSVCALKETLSSYRHRANPVENRKQSFFL